MSSRMTLTGRVTCFNFKVIKVYTFFKNLHIRFSGQVANHILQLYDFKITNEIQNKNM